MYSSTHPCSTAAFSLLPDTLLTSKFSLLARNDRSHRVSRRVHTRRRSAHPAPVIFALVFEAASASFSLLFLFIVSRIKDSCLVAKHWGLTSFFSKVHPLMTTRDRTIRLRKLHADGGNWASYFTYRWQASKRDKFADSLKDGVNTFPIGEQVRIGSDMNVARRHVNYSKKLRSIYWSSSVSSSASAVFFLSFLHI